MDLTKVILEQLTGSALGKLSSLLGTDDKTAGSAVSAAVPSLLASLAGMAAQESGVKKLTGVLSGWDTSASDDFGRILGGNTSSLLEKGTGLLSSLFGDKLTVGLVDAIARFAGVKSGIARSLLAYLLPMVLGKVASLWKSQGSNVAALTTLFADQKKNIAAAVPAGFSLSGIPGLSAVGDAYRFTDDAASYKGGKPAVSTTCGPSSCATRSPMCWLLPLALLLGGGYLLWNLMQPKPAAKPDVVIEEEEVEVLDVPETVKPAVPDVAVALPDLGPLTNDVTGYFTSMQTVFNGIKDAASAEAAEPQLNELNTKLEALGIQLGALPEAGQATIRQLLDQQFQTVQKQVEDAAALPGLADRIKALLGDIVAKIQQLIAGPETK